MPKKKPDGLLKPTAICLKPRAKDRQKTGRNVQPTASKIDKTKIIEQLDYYFPMDQKSSACPKCSGKLEDDRCYSCESHKVKMLAELSLISQKSAGSVEYGKLLFRMFISVDVEFTDFTDVPALHLKFVNIIEKWFLGGKKYKLAENRLDIVKAAFPVMHDVDDALVVVHHKFGDYRAFRLVKGQHEYGYYLLRPRQSKDILQEYDMKFLAELFNVTKKYLRQFFEVWDTTIDNTMTEYSVQNGILRDWFTRVRDRRNKFK